MRRNFLILTIFFSGLLVFINASAAPSARSDGAGFYLDETFFPVFNNSNQTTSVTTSETVGTDKQFGYDLRSTFGYVFSFGLFVGATYNLYSAKTTRDAISGGDNSVDRTEKKTEYGPTLGYIGVNWRFLFSYFISGEKSKDETNHDSTGTLQGDSTYTNAKMSGYQLLIGYSFPVTSSFELSPSLVYRSVRYKTQALTNRFTPSNGYGEQDLTSKNVEDNLSPMISLIFRF